MSNDQLADIIIQKFMPLVFSCDCQGEHADCAQTLSDGKVWTQRDTVERIAQFVRKQ